MSARPALLKAACRKSKPPGGRESANLIETPFPHGRPAEACDTRLELTND